MAKVERRCNPMASDTFHWTATLEDGWAIEPSWIGG